MPPIQTEKARWFSENVQPHETPLRSYLRRALPSLADVDDLVQDCYARILRSWDKGAVRSPRPLLFAIARNGVRSFFHRRSRVEVVSISDEQELPILDDQPGVAETVCRQQELALLSEAIHALPPRCREVLVLRKIKGYTQREIAGMLGISENTVEVLAVRGTRRCAEYLRNVGMKA